MVPPLARSRWQSLGAIARCLGREGLVDELAFALDLKGGSPTIWLEIDVSVRKRVLELMAQKPVIPKSRKTVERAKKPAAKDAVKKVEKGFSAAIRSKKTLGRCEWKIKI